VWVCTPHGNPILSRAVVSKEKKWSNQFNNSFILPYY
jgi:hypothetical protein